MSKTNSGLIAYAKAQLGRPYWYGTFGQKGSAGLYKAKKAQYPDYYPPKSWTEKSFTDQYGQRVHDCAGLIKGYLWSDGPNSTPVYNGNQDYGANGFYNACKKKGSISSFDKVPGRLLFRQSGTRMVHVGVYIGDGYVIEAKGHAYGVVKTKYPGSWTHWGQCHLIAEDVQPKPTPDTKPAAPELPSRSYFKIGDKGENVKQLQRCLCWLFGDDCMAPYGVDGSYGKLTAKCVTRFEKMYNGEIDIEDPGLWGKQCNAKYKSFSRAS